MTDQVSALATQALFVASNASALVSAVHASAAAVDVPDLVAINDAAAQLDKLVGNTFDVVDLAAATDQVSTQVQAVNDEIAGAKARILETLVAANVTLDETRAEVDRGSRGLLDIIRGTSVEFTGLYDQGRASVDLVDQDRSHCVTIVVVVGIGIALVGWVLTVGDLEFKKVDCLRLLRRDVAFEHPEKHKHCWCGLGRDCVERNCLFSGCWLGMTFCTFVLARHDVLHVRAGSA